MEIIEDLSEIARDSFLTMHLVNCGGVIIWSYLGSEPDYRIDSEHEWKEEE
jgi:hypothetical protein